MKEIILTGYSTKEYPKHKHDEDPTRCYLCHITEREEAVLIDKGKAVFVRIELKPLVVRIIDSDLIAKFLLCQNCYLLLDAFARRHEFSQFSGSRRISLN